MIDIARIKNLLLAPREEWPAIAGQPASPAGLYTQHVAPLAAIGPVCGFIGLSLIGIDLPLIGHYHAPIITGVIQAAVSFVLALVGVFVLAAIVNALAPRFSAEPDQAQALKLAAYAATPAWLGGVFRLLPALAPLALLLALYSLYLLYLGLPALMKAPPEKAGVYTIAVIVAALVVAIVVGLVTSAIVPGPALGRP